MINYLENISKDYNKVEGFYENLPANAKYIFDLFSFWQKEIRIVGGSVRDRLLGEEGRDIDFATSATPEEIIFILNKAIEQNQPITEANHGINHGTIVASFINGDQYEITSLGFSMSAEGNKIITTKDNTWEGDAKRRDFTINAMSIDKNNIVYDYFNGIDDLKEQKVIFISQYWKTKLISEPILIYRFLKLISKFSDPIYDKEIIHYLKENLNLLLKVKIETRNWFGASIGEQKYSNNAYKVLTMIGINPDNFFEEF